MESVTDALIEQVRNYLNVTWEDDDTDIKINMLAEDALHAMNHKLGSTSINYTESSAYRRLFLNYCLYSYNGCLEQFDEAYMRELNQCRDRIVIEKRMADDETES